MFVTRLTSRLSSVAASTPLAPSNELASGLLIASWWKKPGSAAIFSTPTSSFAHSSAHSSSTDRLRRVPRPVVGSYW